MQDWTAALRRFFHIESKAEELEALNRDLEGRVFARTLELADSNTSLRRLNRELEMLRRCNRAIVRAGEEAQLLRAICEMAVQAGGYLLAWVGFPQQDECKTVLLGYASGPATSYLEDFKVNWDENTPFGRGPTGNAIRSGRPSICHDTQEAPEFEPWRAAAARHGIRSSIGLPLRSSEGEVFGALMLYGPEPDGFDEREVSLLQELADDLAFGIAGVRARRQYAAAQAALLAERENFHTILDALPPYIVLLTPDYHVVFANREFRRRFGEHGGRRCFEFLFGRSSPCELCETYKVLPTGAPHQWEWTGPDQCSYQVYDFPFTDTDGSKLILEMGADITERKQAERRLADGQFRVRSLIESSLDAIMTTDAVGTITDVNQQMEILTGHSRDQLIGAAFRDFCTEPQLAQEEIELVLRNGKVTDFELTVRAAGGRETPVSYNGNTFYDAAGNLRGVFASARDITDRKRSEHELAVRARQQAAVAWFGQQALTGTELQPVFEAAVATVAETLDVELCKVLELLPSRDRLLLRAGVGWCQGLVGAAVVGAGLDSQAGYTLSVREPVVVRDLQTETRFTGPPLLHEHRVRSGLSVRIATSSGIYGVLGAHSPRLREFTSDDVNFLQSIANILGQVVERNRAEEEIRQLNAELEHRVLERTAELEAANRELEAFSYSVSHDLRAPLRHLDGFSRLLLEEYGPKLEPGATEHLNRIRHAAVHLGQLIDDLLQFSRLGRHALQSQITGLAALVREAIAELAPDCEGREVEWRIGDLPFVECDPALVRQVYINLLSNALKFTRPRSRAVIEIGSCRADGEAALFVADNGVGFSMKYAGKLFRVFQRLHRPEDFEGTGVGLATVKRILQKHGGRIWAEGELDHGARFYFTLSAASTAEVPEPQLAPAGGQHAASNQ